PLALASLALVPLMLPSEEPAPAQPVTEKTVLAGLRDFFAKSAAADGSFRPGIDPSYKGMADTAYSDLAAPAYAVILHRTFGWRLPPEQKTRDFFLDRQVKDGRFLNRAGTVDPASAQGMVYNTTQGLVALRALGEKPRFDPIPVFEGVLREQYKTLPPYSTSFFPLA